MQPKTLNNEAPVRAPPKNAPIFLPCLAMEMAIESGQMGSEKTECKHPFGRPKTGGPPLERPAPQEALRRQRRPRLPPPSVRRLRPGRRVVLETGDVGTCSERNGMAVVVKTA